MGKKSVLIMVALVFSLSGFKFGLTDKVILRVGDSKLTQNELKEKIAALPPQYQEYYGTAEGKKILIDSIKKEYLIFEVSQKENYAEDKDVLAQLETIKKQVMVTQFLKDNVEDKVKVTNKDVKNYFNDNKEQFQKDDQVKARHILVKDESEAKEIIEKLGKGDDFKLLAKEYSIDPGSKVNGGDLGWFTKGQMVKPFESAAFDLEKGKYTKEPVQTQYGYHVIMVEDKKDPEVLEYKDVKAEIEAFLKQKAQKEALDGLLEDAEKKITVEDFSEQLLLDEKK